MNAVLQLNNLLQESTQRNRPITVEKIVALIVNYRLLPRLVGELIIERAIASFTCTKEEIDKAYQQFCWQHRITRDKERRLWLEEHYLTLEQLKELVTRKLKIAKFKQANWSHKVDSYFHQRKPQLDRVIYSSIQVSDGDLALELYFRLIEGEASFGDLARQYSEGTQAKAGGVHSAVELGSCPTSLAKMFSASLTGQVWYPHPVGSSVVIVKLEQYISAQLDNQMRQRLLDELFATWLQEQIAKTTNLTPS